MADLITIRQRIERIAAPAETGVSYTPTNDIDEFTEGCRGIYVGGGGNMTVRMWTGGTVTFTNVLAGSLLPLIAKGINATSLTATNIIILY